MSGRPEFENQTQITATTGKMMASVKGLQTTSLASGVYERITIYAPVGTIARIVNLYLSWDNIPGQNAGYRGFQVSNKLATGELVGQFYSRTGRESADYTPGSSAWTSKYSFDQGNFKYSDDYAGTRIEVYPSEASINANLRACTFDENIGITLEFFHTATGSVTAERSYRLIYETEVVQNG